jgi:hypothetical protein
MEQPKHSEALTLTTPVALCACDSRGFHIFAEDRQQISATTVAIAPHLLI